MKKGWEMMKLGDVALTFGRGKSKHRPRNDEKLYGGDYPFIQTGDVRNANKFISQYSQTYNEVGLAQSKLWPKGTICITIAANIAETGILDFDSCFPDSMIGFVVDPKKANVDFAYYCLQFVKAELQLLGKGSAQANINMETFETQKFPFPSIKEQQRIVSILDEAFAAIDQAKENVQRNLQNAKELFQSESDLVFSDNKHVWNSEKLGTLCLTITKGSSPKWQGINYVDKPGILFVTSENVGEFQLLLKERKYVEEKFNEKDKKSILKKGDVLTNIVGASIGRTAIYDIDDVANINQAVCILRCNETLLNNEFLTYLLNSPFLKKILHDNEVNNARANLSLGFFSNLKIPLPSLKEQKKVVHQLDTLSIETKKLESLYQQKLNSLEELKKGILQKAFSGELLIHEQKVL